MAICDYIDHMSMNLRKAEFPIGRRLVKMIPMRDGVKLYTVFWLPQGEGPHKVLFSRTPYPASEEKYEYQGKVFTERGYGFIYQYCRGTGKSEGVWEPFKNERADGIDALNWLQAEECIESIGLYGYSYLSFVQWIVLDALPSKVKTAYLEHYGTRRYHQMYCNGMFRYDIYSAWATSNAGAADPPSYDKVLEAGFYRPHIAADRDVWGMDIPWYRQWLESPDQNSSYWRDSFWDILSKSPSKINIPVAIGCGWYDHHFGGMMEGYRDLSDYAKKHSRLVIGPWAHSKNPCVDRVDTSDAFEGGLHGFEGVLQWMDKILKYKETPDTEVLAYSIGQGWRKFSVWDAETTTQKLFFSNTKLLEAPPEEESIGYVYDPAEVMETRGAECMCYAPLAWRGSRKQPKPQYRKDMISLVSAPLKRDLVIKGAVKIGLCVSSDAEDTAFVVRLMEITPKGESYNIRTGATTLRYRNDSGTAIDYIPNTKAFCEIELWDILWKLSKGSKIRIDVSSSSFPEYHIHLNTKQLWAYETKGRVAHQKIWCGENGSFVALPVETEE